MSVPVSKWVGQCLSKPRGYLRGEHDIVQDGEPWPSAAWGSHGKVFRVDVSEFPRRHKQQNLADFLRYEGKPLSVRATAGFLERAARSRLRFPDGFLDQVRTHLRRMQEEVQGS